MNCLICVEDSPLAASVEAAVQSYTEAHRCAPPELTKVDPTDAVVIIDDKALGAVPRAPSHFTIGITSGSVADGVELMARHPWLQQLGTPALFESDGLKWLLYRLTRQVPELDNDTLTFLGQERLHARRVLFYKSRDIESRLARLEEFASSVGARSRAIEQLHDITNELLVNAFYDAPYEAGLFREPPARQQPIEMPPDMPCELVYGATESELFVRVRDCFGALTRQRLLDVLLRCARGANVELDESRGGAGLGMWRIFRQSSRVIISVEPGASTEMLVTVPKSGVQRKNLRAWHFLFDDVQAGGGPARTSRAR